MAQATQKKKIKKSKKDKAKIAKGQLYINATFNNTIITATDMKGDVLAWASGGSMEFKGSRKSTPYAAQMAARKVVEDAKKLGMQEINVFIKGPGVGRESVVRAIAASGLKIKFIKDVTPIPHNGCRPRKKRRV